MIWGASRVAMLSKTRHLKKSLTALLRITWVKLICDRLGGRAAAAAAVSSCRRDRLIVLTATCVGAEDDHHKSVHESLFGA